MITPTKEILFDVIHQESNNTISEPRPHRQQSRDSSKQSVNDSNNNMIKHLVFGKQRDIDIPPEVFPTQTEMEKLESYLPGCEHGWFDSVHEGKKLHYRRFLPSNNAQRPNAIVIWMHGVQSHCGRAYVEGDQKFNMSLLSDTCLKEGWALYAHDMIGHGYSEGARHYLPNTEAVVNDYLSFVKLVTSLHDEDTPLFLIGESFGGCLAMCLARYYQDHPTLKPKGFRGIVLLAPAVHIPPVWPIIILALEWFLALFFPYWRPPTSIPNPISPHYVWRDPKMLYLYAQEERIVEMLLEPGYKHSNMGTSLTMFKCIRDTRRDIMPGFQEPLLVFHGTGDRAVRKEGSSEYMLKRISTPKQDVDYKLVDGAYHDLLADPANHEVLRITTNWINERIMLPPAARSEKKLKCNNNNNLSICNNNNTILKNSDEPHKNATAAPSSNKELTTTTAPLTFFNDDSV